MKQQLTGNAGMYHVARELSRRGWHVMPTVRNARGADLYAVGDDEQTVHAIQSKALSKKTSVPLGSSLENLRSTWWVITLYALEAAPVCYVMTLAEVKASAYEGKNGAPSFWLEAKSYVREQYLEKWERLGDPTAPSSSLHYS